MLKLNVIKYDEIRNFEFNKVILIFSLSFFREEYKLIIYIIFC